jgi:hypothetical protein
MGQKYPKILLISYDQGKIARESMVRHELSVPIILCEADVYLNSAMVRAGPLVRVQAQQTIPWWAHLTRNSHGKEETLH